ncbi:hypothetical protein ABW19_dt0210490 [Dactylella cylindrospora]|nr:hypothetical protein ABW19_dt0210490 [Dactylella cylindrospora]
MKPAADSIVVSMIGQIGESIAISRSDKNFLTGTVEGRGVREWSIKFSRAFRKIPEVVIWMTGVDIHKTLDASIDLEVRAVTTSGFRFLPKITNPNTWVSFSWLAYSPDAAGIMSGFLEFGTRKHDFTETGRVAFPPGVFSQRPRVLASLHAFTLHPLTGEEAAAAKRSSPRPSPRASPNQGVAEIETEIGKVTQDGFTWTFNSSVPKGCKVVMQWIALI